MSQTTEERVAVLESQMKDMNRRFDDMISEIHEQNGTLAGLRIDLGSVNEKLGKLAGKLGGANLVIPVLTAMLGILATLVALHV